MNLDELIIDLLKLRLTFGSGEIPVWLAADSEGNEYARLIDVEPVLHTSAVVLWPNWDAKEEHPGERSSR